MTDPDDYDTTEKIVQTSHGYELTVKHKRGTGTRDQDSVKMAYESESIPAGAELGQIVHDVTATMADLRAHQPDEDGDADE